MFRLHGLMTSYFGGLACLGLGAVLLLGWLPAAMVLPAVGSWLMKPAADAPEGSVED